MLSQCQIGVKYWHQPIVILNQNATSVQRHVYRPADVILMPCACWEDLSNDAKKSAFASVYKCNKLHFKMYSDRKQVF